MEDAPYMATAAGGEETTCGGLFQPVLASRLNSRATSTFTYRLEPALTQTLAEISGPGSGSPSLPSIPIDSLAVTVA